MTAAVATKVTQLPKAECPYKLASRENRPEDTVVDIKGVKIGLKGDPIVMAGPCAVESLEQVEEIACRVAKAGAKIIRGGAFKPRTSPYSFQGLGLEGLKILSAAAKKHGLLVVSEVMEIGCIEEVAEYADILQIGSRNMQNFPLLREVGKYGKPVLLKRGMSATLEELLCAAEYLLVNGTKDVILCERGIRSFDPSTRNTLDLSAVPILKSLTHLPIIVDPSHACGRRDIVTTMARAALAAGADGLIVEVAADPDNALCDGKQSLYLPQFDELMRQVNLVRELLAQI